MPLPLIHQAAMEQTCKLLKSIHGIELDPGNWLDNIKPDRIGLSHGFNYANNTGNIFDLVSEHYMSMMYGGIDVDNVRFLVHYIADALTVGQMHEDLWGKKDNLMDVRGELIKDKKKDIMFDIYCNNPKKFFSTWGNMVFDELFPLWKKEILNSYLIYKPKTDSIIRFLFSNSIKQMYRNAVNVTAVYSVAFIDSTMGAGNDK